MTAHQPHGRNLPFKNPIQDWAKPDPRLFITPEADTFLRSMNRYEQGEVARVIQKLSRLRYTDAHQYRDRPMDHLVRDSQCASGRFVLTYFLRPDQVLVTAIGFNRQVLQVETPQNRQAGGLFSAKRSTTFKYTGTLDDDALRVYQREWSAKPTTQVTTQHAAINGMQNDLGKAVWLMGAHIDAAYANEKTAEYTLFHNPTRGVLLDLFECMADKVAVTKLAKNLAAILNHCQINRRSVKWVAHSQGGIILNSAVVYHNKTVGTPLTLQTVSIHAGGNNKRRAEKAFREANMVINDLSRNNPYDMVPNLAGNNDWSWSGVKRSVRFSPYVLGQRTNGCEQVSPHTLPYMGMECYIRHLEMSQKHDLANKVRAQQEKLIS